MFGFFSPKILFKKLKIIQKFHVTKFLTQNIYDFKLVKISYMSKGPKSQTKSTNTRQHIAASELHSGPYVA